MEGGRRFEQPRYRPETPESTFRNEIRFEVREIYNHTKDELTFEVAKKILQKIEIKDRIDELQRYKDDPSVYQPWKQLGLFIVVDSEAELDWRDEASGFEVKKGDRVLDIHLPPVREEQRNLAEVTRSLKMIAQYIKEQKLDPKYIMGVTFEKLASVSRRQGFTVVEPQIPDEIKRGVQNVFRRFHEDGINEESLGKILLCYQDTDKFLDKYLPH